MLIQQDAQTALIRELGAVVEDIPVRSELPTKWNHKNGPAITVSTDGTPVPNRSWTVELVRVTVYAAFAPDARGLAAQLEAYLLDPRHAVGFTITSAIGLDVTRDMPDNTRWLASFTVRAATNRKDSAHGDY
ncbi:hypothetical protein [Corynebacterium kalidii]